MAKNHRGKGEVVVVTAAAARTSGALVREQQLVGIVQTTALSGARYPLAITEEWEVPLVSNAAKGDQVFISTDGNNTVGRAAAGTAIGVGTVYVGRVTGVPGDPSTADATTSGFPAAGFMTVKLNGAAVA